MACKVFSLLQRVFYKALFVIYSLLKCLRISSFNGTHARSHTRTLEMKIKNDWILLYNGIQVVCKVLCNILRKDCPSSVYILNLRHPPSVDRSAGTGHLT